MKINGADKEILRSGAWLLLWLSLSIAYVVLFSVAGKLVGFLLAWVGLGVGYNLRVSSEA